MSSGRVERVVAVTGAGIAGYGFYLSVRERLVGYAIANAALLSVQLAVAILITFVGRRALA